MYNTRDIYICLCYLHKYIQATTQIYNDTLDNSTKGSPITTWYESKATLQISPNIITNTY